MYHYVWSFPKLTSNINEHTWISAIRVYCRAKFHFPDYQLASKHNNPKGEPKLKSHKENLFEYFSKVEPTLQMIYFY